MTKHMSDEAFAACCRLYAEEYEGEKDPVTMGIAEIMICDAAMQRRQSNLSAQLAKIGARRG